MCKPYEKKTYYAITLDPVHVGTGGYRLGRVDNTITREPGTNLPKIPGTSLAGVTRAYTAMAAQSKNPVRMKYQRERYKENTKPDGTKEQIITYESCAGKGIDDGEGHCGEPDCEVCIPFGFSKGKSNTSFQGLAQFFDARILFFPVHSMIGPVWVTGFSVLHDFQGALKDQAGVDFDCGTGLIVEDNDKVITDLVAKDNKLNLGWFYLQNSKKIKIVSSHNLQIDSVIIDRLVLVSDKLFSRVVNDNLEVRTSVAIDPATGAAEDGALYTYEAIPRATVMWFEVVYNKPEYFRIKTKGGNEEKILKDKDKNIEADWRWVKDNVEEGFPLIEHMGVGGMNTRGMGRLRVFI